MQEKTPSKDLTLHSLEASLEALILEVASLVALILEVVIDTLNFILDNVTLTVIVCNEKDVE